LVDPLYLSKDLDEEEMDKFINKVASEIVRRRLATPAIIMLESSKPLTFVASQAMIFFDPMVNMVTSLKSYSKFQKILEDRDRVEQLISTIEKLEDERILKEKESKHEKGGN